MNRTLPSNFARRDRWLIVWLVSLWMLVLPMCERSEAADNAAPKENSPSETEPKKDETFSNWLGGNTEYSGWVNLSLGSASVSGSQSTFKQRYGINSGMLGGVSEFYWEKFVGEKGMFKMSGQTVGGNEDYDFKMDYTKKEVGYLRAGTSRHRTWYDGSGGFDPTTGAWFPLNDRDLSLDRGSYWVEGGVTLPDWPAFGIRYEHHYREGEKDSTVWGTTPAFAGGRSIAASFRGINETRDILKLDMKHTMGKTDIELGLNLERFKSDNSLNFSRDTGTPALTFTTQREQMVSDLVSVHGSTETRLKDNLSFSSGYSFTTMDVDFSGSRIIGNSYDPVFDPSLARFPGFTGLIGGTELKQHVVSISMAWLPSKVFSIVPSVRLDSLGLGGGSMFTLTPVTADSLQSMASTQDFLDLSERLEARYTGFTNWVFYARGDWDQGDGDLREKQFAVTTGTLQFQRQTDFTRFTQKYSAGANWYPQRRLNMAVQYYYKLRENDYNHLIDTTSNVGVLRYPAYLTSQNFDTHDANYRITWRPLNTVISVTRYDFQFSTINTGGGGLPAVESARQNSHIFSESLTWTPLTRLYLQGTFNYVIDTTKTPSDQTAPAGVVLKSENNYWNTGCSLGYALDKRTDLATDYQYSAADNFVDNSTASQPYGAGFREHSVTVTLTRRIKENLRVMLRYGYFANHDLTCGGNQDYHAHLLYSSLQWRF